MFGEIVFGGVIVFAVFYCVYGSILSRQLSEEIDYQDGFLSLWNKMQFSLVSTASDLPKANTERAIKLQARLFKLIKLSYIVMIGGAFLAFFSDIAAP